MQLEFFFHRDAFGLFSNHRLNFRKISKGRNIIVIVIVVLICHPAMCSMMSFNVEHL